MQIKVQPNTRKLPRKRRCSSPAAYYSGSETLWQGSLVWIRML
jgi:hypothetical protein